MTHQSELSRTPVPVHNLRPGQTIEVGERRYTVDHVLPIATRSNAVVHTTAGKLPLAGNVDVLTERGIPALGTERESRPARSIVHHWSGMTLRTPGVLVARGQLRRGDVVQSSHGFTVSVTDVVGQRLRGELHRAGSGVTHTEHYDPNSLIPVLRFAPRTSTCAAAPSLERLEARARKALSALAAVSPAAADALVREFVAVDAT